MESNEQNALEVMRNGLCVQSCPEQNALQPLPTRTGCLKKRRAAISFWLLPMSRDGAPSSTSHVSYERAERTRCLKKRCSAISFWLLPMSRDGGPSMTSHVS